MSGSEILLVTRDSRPGDRHHHSDPYPEALWLPVVGPTSYLMWLILARTLEHTPVVHLDTDELAERLGLGSSGGNQSGVAKALRRMQRFELVSLPDSGAVAVRHRLPDLPGRHLRRLDWRLQARHRDLAAAGTATPIDQTAGLVVAQPR